MEKGRLCQQRGSVRHALAPQESQRMLDSKIPRQAPAFLEGAVRTSLLAQAVF